MNDIRPDFLKFIAKAPDYILLDMMNNLKRHKRKNRGIKKVIRDIQSELWRRKNGSNINYCVEVA